MDLHEGKQFYHFELICFLGYGKNRKEKDPRSKTEATCFEEGSDLKVKCGESVHLSRCSKKVVILKVTKKFAYIFF